MRRLVADVHVAPSDLVLPVFVKEGIAEPSAISSMPGVVQHTKDTLRGAAAEAVAARAAENGLLLLTCGIHHQVIRWIPPIDVTVAEVEEALGTFERALRG
jgi:hypothetical protein